VGWAISRDIANLGFVIIMIVMAVATIVRYERYSVKLLPILIAAAILVNFSLTIAGVFIDFADTVSDAFYSRFNSEHITDALAGAFNPQRLLLTDENPPPPDPADQGNAFSDFSAAVLMGIAGAVFNVIFLAIAALSMVALALMLLYRYIYLSIILVLAPIAWLFWVFPDLKSHFSDWWKNFIKWVFFLPAVTFFLYLAVETASALGKTPMFTQGSIFSASGFAGLMSNGAQMIVLAGLLLGGLIAAQSMSIAGASGAIGLATKAKDATLGAAGKFAKTKATNVGRRVLAGGVDTEGKTRFERWGASKAGKIPLFGAALTGLAGMSARARINNKKDLEDAQKKTENRSGEEATNILNRQLTRGIAMSDADLAAWGIRAAEKQKWSDIKPEVQKRIIDAVKRTNSQDKLLNNAPHLYQDFGLDPDRGKAAGKAVGKYLQDASKIDASYLRYQNPTTQQFDNNISINLRNSHISQLANSGTREQRQVVADAVKDTLGQNLLTAIEQATNNITAAKGSGNAAQLQTAKDALGLLVQNFTDDEKKAYNVYQNIQSNVNWSDVAW
jgi:hypothetical protein